MKQNQLVRTKNNPINYPMVKLFDIFLFMTKINLRVYKKSFFIIGVCHYSDILLKSLIDVFCSQGKPEEDP